jgi:hypothetical protein
MRTFSRSLIVLLTLTAAGAAQAAVSTRDAAAALRSVAPLTAWMPASWLVRPILHVLSDMPSPPIPAPPKPASSQLAPATRGQ